MILTQTKALAIDAYRELNAKKLFWITLALTGLVIFILAGMRFDEEGVGFLVWDLSFLPFRAAPEASAGEDTIGITKATFYKIAFQAIGLNIWLTWIATILALVSTAGIIPDLVSGGSIETVLSKPIGRVRLFLTKYLFGLTFAGLQVGVFSLGSFLVFGLRADVWEPSLFLAIPIVLAFFSFLYCICAFVGLVTRSTVYALLLTLLFWGVLFLVNMADGILLMFKSMQELRVEQRITRIELLEERTTAAMITDREQQGLEVEGWQPTQEEMEAVNAFLASNNRALEPDQNALEQLQFWSGLVFTIKTVLPKTGETIALLERHLIDLDDIPQSEDASAVQVSVDTDDIDVDEDDVSQRVNEELRDRSIAWILGTSIGFEVVILGIGCLIFARKDY